MLKISRVGTTNHAVILRLEGRVVGRWVAQLQKSSEEVLAEGRPLKLQLADVEFMDTQGVALLLNLRSRGVALLECPPFAAEQLKMADRSLNSA
jgi:anti-anti-sigma regulatory factor